MKFDAYDFMDRWESLKLNAYKDSGGVPTIGWGHTKNVKMGDVITKEQAKVFLDQDLAGVEAAVNKLVKVPLNQNQYNALVSLAFNIGVGGFTSSTVLNRLNAGNYTGAAEAMTWWNQVKGKVVQGLVNRRAAEKVLFLTPTMNVDEEIRALLNEYTQKLMEILNART